MAREKGQEKAYDQDSIQVKEGIEHVRMRPAMYVGDIYEVDVVGSRRAGMDVILLDPLGNHGERDAHTARGIRDLTDQLLLRADRRGEP